MILVTMKEKLLQAPEGQVSEIMRADIARWSNPPTLDEIRDTRNSAAYTSECSDFVITLLNVMIGMAEKAQ